MPKFLEDKLKQEYGADSKTPYKVMNKIGAMRGNKETAKGRAMEAKHTRDVAAGKSKSSKRPARKPAPRDTAGTFSGPAGPFGTLSRAPRAARNNPKTLAGRRSASRQLAYPEPSNDTDNDNDSY